MLQNFSWQFLLFSLFFRSHTEKSKALQGLSPIFLFMYIYLNDQESTFLCSFFSPCLKWIKLQQKKLYSICMKIFQKKNKSRLRANFRAVEAGFLKMCSFHLSLTIWNKTQCKTGRSLQSLESLEAMSAILGYEGWVFLCLPSTCSRVVLSCLSSPVGLWCLSQPWTHLSSQHFENGGCSLHPLWSTLVFLTELLDYRKTQVTHWMARQLRI